MKQSLHVTKVMALVWTWVGRFGVLEVSRVLRKKSACDPFSFYLGTPCRPLTNRLRTTVLKYGVFWVTPLTRVWLEKAWGTRLCATYCTDYCNLLQQPLHADSESGLSFSWLPIPTLFLQHSESRTGFCSSCSVLSLGPFFFFFHSCLCSSALNHFQTAVGNLLSTSHHTVCDRLQIAS